MPQKPQYLEYFGTRQPPRGVRLLYRTDEITIINFHYFNLKSRDFRDLEYFWTRSPSKRVRLVDLTDKMLVLLFYLPSCCRVIGRGILGKLSCRGMSDLTRQPINHVSWWRSLDSYLHSSLRDLEESDLSMLRKDKNTWDHFPRFNKSLILLGRGMIT